MPQFLIHFFNIDYEEPYIIAPLALVFSLLLFLPRARSGWEFSLFITTFLGGNLALFLTKSTLVYPVLVLAIASIRLKPRLISIVSIACIFGAMFGMAFLNYSKSNQFTLSSSWDGWNLSKGNNEYTLDYYPLYNCDILYRNGSMEPKRPFTDEWDYDRYYRDEFIRFIQKTPQDFALLTTFRFGAFFLEVRPFGLNPGEVRYDSFLKYVGTLYMIAFRILFIGTLVSALSYLIMKCGKFGVSFLFLALVFAYAGPFLIGFSYERHLIPLVMPTILYAIYVVRWKKGDLEEISSVAAKPHRIILTAERLVAGG